MKTMDNFETTLVERPEAAIEQAFARHQPCHARNPSGLHPSWAKPSVAKP